jgi:hypothetical protein
MKNIIGSLLGSCVLLVRLESTLRLVGAALFVPVGGSRRSLVTTSRAVATARNLRLASYSERVNGEGSNRESSGSSSEYNTDQTTKSSPLRPQTGWFHNPPSEASDFWRGPRNEKSRIFLPQREQPQSSSGSTNSKLRTGWLHNNKPAASTAEQQTPKTTLSTSSGSSSSMPLARRRLEMAQLQQERNHRILCPPTLHAAGEDQVVAVTEHLISVPIHRDQTEDTTAGKSQRLDVYFTIVEKLDTEATRKFFQFDLTNQSPQQRAAAYVQHAALSNADSLVLFLQGGPGFGAPVPGVTLSLSKGSGSWADAALYQHGYQRLVLMDQRGTGRSTPVTKQTLERQFPDLFLLDQSELDSNNKLLEDTENMWNEADKARVLKAVDEVTDYLAQFRADNIVRDAEYIREALMYQRLEDSESDGAIDLPRPWGCSLGQSYGGFCHMTYLSKVEHPPKVMLFTGGIAPMLSKVDEVYGVLWNRVRERNQRFYEMFPGDIAAVKLIVRRLLHQPVKLPSGGRLTARRFLSLGISLGGSPSAFSSLHDLISSAFVGGQSAAYTVDNLEDLEFSRAFLKQIESQQSFDDHPIYFWLHESIYADGPEHSPTSWAAERAYNSKLEDEASAYDYKRTSQIQSDDEPTLFFGEHVFSWMSEDFVELNGVGLRALANSLAAKADWGKLFDADRMKRALGDGRTQAAAAIYHEDMYVEFDACMKVVARDGPLGKCKIYVTNEFQHSGLRDGGAALFSKLHGMAKGGTRTPS